MPDPINQKGYITPIVTPKSDGSVDVSTAVVDPYALLASRIKSELPKANTSFNSVNAAELPSTGRYPLYFQGADNEEVYGTVQPWTNKFNNDFKKMLGIAGSTFLSGTVGTVDGISEWMSTGKFSSVWDNETNRKLNEWTQGLENSLPNYTTRAEENSSAFGGIIPGTPGSSNFWFDKVMKNLGFSGGALLGGLAWGTVLKGIGLTGALAKGGTNMVEFADGMEAALQAVPQAEKSLSALNYLRAAVPKAIGTAINTNDKASRILTAAFGTFGEASIEALNNSNQFKEARISDFEKVHGYKPVGAELDKINEEAEHVGNWSLGLNTALLTGTNYVMFPKILNMSAKAETSILVKGMETQKLRQLETGLIESALPQRGFAKKLTQGKNALGLLFNPTEAFEEGAQAAIQFGTQDFFKKQYDGEPSSFLSSLGYGVDETLTSKEGLENILIGGLSGALQSGISNVKERGVLGYGGTRAKATQEALTQLNNPEKSFGKSLKDNVEAYKRAQTIQSQREAAIRQGDLLESKDLEREYQFNYLFPRIKYGKYDFVQGDIDRYKQLATSPEGFEQLQREGYANETDTQQQFLERLNNFETHAKSVKESYDYLQNKYGQNRNFRPEVFDRLAYNMSKIQNYDERIQQLSTGLLKRQIPVQSILDELHKGNPSDVAIKESIKAIDDLNEVDSVKDDLKQELRDIVELGLRRTEFKNEYNQIIKTPQLFKETPPKPAKIQPTIKIKTKVGESEYEVGTEYYLGRVVEYDANGKEVYRFPKLTILGENEDGTIKIKTSSGEVRDISKSVLEDYKLGKVSDLEGNKKAKFYFDHINDVFEFNFGKGKKQIGRLQFSSKEGILLFSYKNKYGKIKSIEVTGDQFVPKKGFTSPMISKVGTLSSAQAKSLSDFAAEKDERINQKRSSRLAIIEGIVNETGARISKIEALLKTRYEEFQRITSELSALEQKIKAGGTTSRNNFKSTTNKAIKAANKLSRLQEELRLEIQALEADKEEQEFNLEYFYDIAQNIDELPTDSTDFLEELNNQTKEIENLILDTGDSINKVSKLLTSVQGALDNAIDWVLENIKLFEFNYPKAPQSIDNQEFVDFLKQNPNFLKLKPQYKEDLKQLEEFVSQVEDLDIIPNERTVKELRTELESLTKQLENLEKEYKARSIITDKFNAIVDTFKQEQAVKDKLANDQKLREAFFSTRKSLEDGDDIVSGDDKESEEELKKIDITVIAKASTEPMYDSSSEHNNAHRRHQEFLLNISTNSKLRDLYEEGKIRILPVTAKTEEGLGLKGIINPQFKETSIRYVYVLDNSNGTLSYLDKEGNLILATSSKNSLDIERRRQDELDKKQKFTLNRANKNLEQAPIIDYSEIEAEKSGLDYTNDEVKEVKVLEYRGINSQGQRVGTVRIQGVTKEGELFADTFEVFFNDNKINAKYDAELASSNKGGVDLNTIVFTNAREADLSYTDKNGVRQISYTNKTNLDKEQVEQVENSWENYRKLMLNANITPENAVDNTFKFEISRGIPVVVNPSTKNSIFDIGLIKEEDLFNPLITIPAFKGDVKTIDVPIDKTSLKASMPLGKPLFNYRGNMFFLNNRNFTKDEASNIAELLVLASNNLMQDGKIEPRVENYLKSVIRFSPKAARNSIYFDNFFGLHIGDKGNSIAINDISKSKDVIALLLEKEVYHHISKDELTEFAKNPGKTPYTELKVENGNITEVIYPSYQHYLLLGKEPVLSTNIAIPQDGKPALEQKYAIVDIKDLDIANIVSSKPAPKAEQKITSLTQIKVSSLLPKKAAEKKPGAAPLTVEDLLNKKKKVKFSNDGFDEPQTKLTNNPFHFIGDKSKELEEVQRMLPGVDIRMVSKLIDATGGLVAWGYALPKLITLYEGAPFGVAYHEAFEQVFNWVLTPEQQLELYGEFAVREGSFRTYKGEYKLFRDANIKEAKEQMADEFAEFKATGKIPYPKKNTSSFFKKLWELLKSIFLTNKLDTVFKKLNNGEYANSPITVNGKAEKQFSRKVTNTPEALFQDTINGMTAQLFIEKWTDDVSLIEQLEDNELESTKPLFDKLFAGLDKYYTQPGKNTLNSYYGKLISEDPSLEEKYSEEYEKVQQLWENVKDNWGNYMEDLKSFLKTFDVAFTTGEDGEIVLASELEDEYKKLGGADSYNSESRMHVNAKNSASKAVKLLFATVADSNFVFETTKNELNAVTSRYTGLLSTNRGGNQMKLPDLANYAKLFNYTLHNSANTNGIRNIYNNLRVQASKLHMPINANLTRLLNRLGYNGSFAGMSKESIKLVLKVENALSKTKPQYFKQYVHPKEGVIHQSSNISNRAEQIVAEWINSLKSSPFVTIEKDKIKFNSSVINADNFVFLSNLGVSFTKSDYDNLSKGAQEQFNKEIAFIKGEVKGYTSKYLPATGNIGFSARLKTLAELYAENIEGDSTESQHTNLSGETYPNFILPNYVSYILNDLNNVSTKDEFIALNPQFSDLYMGSSYILNNVLFDENGKRTSVKIDTAIAEGIYASNGTILPHEKMSYSGRLLNEINNNFNGISTLLVPADAKTPWGLNLGNQLTTSFFKDKDKAVSDYMDVMWGALLNEVELAKDYNNRKGIVSLNQTAVGETRQVGKSLRFFKNVIGEQLVNRINEKLIDGKDELTPEQLEAFKVKFTEDFKKFIEKQADKTINNLKGYRLIDSWGKNFKLYGVDAKFLKKIGVGQSISEEKLKDLFFFREANYFLNNMELHKLLFNDPAQYKDEIKRTKSFGSGREYTHSDSQSDLNSALNEKYNTQGDYKLKSTDWGYKKHLDEFNVITRRTIKVPSENDYGYEQYKTNDIADAQSWVIDTTYREMLIKSGGRFDNKQEALHDWLMAWARRDGFQTGKIKEENYPSELQKADEKILKKPIPDSSLQILKPIITGVRVDKKGVANQFLYKTSTAPLYLYFVKGTQMEEEYWDAVENNVHVIAMDSAHKVGMTDANTLNWGEKLNKKLAVPINYRYFGIQVETGGTKDSQTQGSQLTKLATSGLMSNGVPISEEAGKLVSRHKEALINLTLERSKALLNKLDIKNGEFGFTIDDKRKVADFLLKEITRRELPDNIAIGIETNEENQFNSPLEANVNYKKIKEILFSTIENNILKPKVNGGPKILLSSLGFDEVKVNGKEVTINKRYKFYEEKDGRYTCQIGIPFMFGAKMLQQIEKSQGIKFDSQKEGFKHVLEYLNTTEEGKSLLRGIGFRIPTQGLNSVDHFEIVEFLPPQMGDCVIFPAEITTKAGSDFDIDKMSIYLKNYYIDVNGYPKLISNNKEVAIKQLEDKFFEDLQEKIDKGDKSIQKTFNLQSVLSSIVLGESTEKSKNKWTAILRKMFGEDVLATDIEDILMRKMEKLGKSQKELSDWDIQEALKDKYLEEGIIKSLENEYFDILGEILSLKETRPLLLKPNDAQQLKDISRTISPVTEKVGDYTNFVDSDYMFKKRQLFLAMKSAVGIPAVSNTNLALNQYTNLIINPTAKQIKKNFKLRFPHNSSGERGINLSHLTSFKSGEKDVEQFISDLGSQVIDGTVDVAKDEWLPKMLGDANNLNILLFLYKAGVNPYSAALFLNQPSIREFSKRVDISNNSSLFNPRVKKQFPGIIKNDMIKKVVKYKSLEKKFFESKPNTYTNKDMKLFLDVPYNDLTSEQLYLQLQMLDDFFSIRELTRDLFSVVNAYNFDTSRFQNSEAVAQKQLDLQKGLELPNVIGTKDLFTKTHLGTVVTSVLDTTKGLNTLFSTQRGEAKRIQNQFALNIRTQFFKRDDREKFSQAAEQSMIDFAVNTKGLINSIPIENISKDEFFGKLTIADWVKAMQGLPSLANNPIIHNIEAVTDKREGQNSYLKLREQDFDSFTSNIWTAALRELRDSGEIVELDGKQKSVSNLFQHLLISQFLQNGTARNRSSFLHLIPNEEYSKIVSPVLQDINADLAFWLREGLYYRNNYQNSNLISEVPKQESSYMDEESGMEKTEYIVPKLNSQVVKESLEKAGYNSDILALKAFEFKSKQFVKVTNYEYDDNGNVIDKEILLYKRVDKSENEPISIKLEGEKVLFKAVNKLGNDNLKEYYSNTVKSVLPENKAFNEISDRDLSNLLRDAKFDIFSISLGDLVSSDDYDVSLDDEQESVNLKPGKC